MCRGSYCKPDLGLLPMFTGIIMAAGIVTTYSIAVGLGHVSPLLPSISDTGIMSPEMHIFSQVLNVVAAMSLVTFVLRYKMIHALLDEEDSAKLLKLTRINLVTGCIASFGLSVVGNFQDDKAFRVHMTGAFMVFLFGNCYCIMDAVIAYKMHPKYYNGMTIFWLRLFIGAFGLTLFIIAMTSFIIAHKEATKNDFSRQHWKNHQPDNTSAIVHLIGAFMVFLLGNIYMIIDAIVTHRMHPKYNGITIFGGRLFLGIVGLTTFVISVVAASVATKNSIFNNKDQRLHWGPDDPGYAAHLVSTFGEWTMGLSFICYYFTYIRDFGKFGADLLINMKVGHLDQTPLSYEDEPKSGLARENGSQQDEPNEQTGLLS